MEWINDWLGRISGWVWGPPLLVLLFGTHLYLTFRLRFIQRYVLHGIRLSLQRTKEWSWCMSLSKRHKKRPPPHYKQRYAEPKKVDCYDQNFNIA